MQVIGEKREGEINITSRSGGMVTIDETYHYIVQADSKTDDRLTVSACPGLPVVGVTLSAGGLAICKSKQGTRRADNPILWDWTCTFSSEVEQDSDQNNQPPGSDPNTWVPVRKTMMMALDTVEFTDQAGNPATASNQQWYSDGIRRRRYIPVWEFAQFEPATVSDETMCDRNETVNASTYKGKAAKTLLLTVVDSTLGFYYGQKRRLTIYRMAYNVKTWQEKRVDYGSYYWSTPGTPPSGTKLPFRDDTGSIIPFGYLDNSGGARSLASAPLTKAFDVYATDSWTFLRI